MDRITESANPNTKDIDSSATVDILDLISNADQTVASVVRESIGQISETVDKIVERVINGGRLFYIGTGTSGRLGVLDAAELPPTFGVSGDLVTGVIAGGYEALYRAVEASEDDREAGAEDLRKHGISEKDSLIGIAASGTTPYTIGGVEYARSIGALTACITCNPDTPLADAVEIPIEVIVGPEVIAGSTRMKAGTAQKLVLNMISTALMIKLGYVRGNRMINVKASNKKLVARSLRLLETETGLSAEEAAKLFESAGSDLKTALVMHEAGTDVDTAMQALDASSLSVSAAVAHLKKIHG